MHIFEKFIVYLLNRKKFTIIIDTARTACDQD